MKIKTSELTGAILDWAVAKCESKLISVWAHNHHKVWVKNKFSFEDERIYEPSTDWAQGGPIIERECIISVIGEWDIDKTPVVQQWAARTLAYEIFGATDEGWSYGPTPLIAAMRCFVASNLGDEVEVPNEV